MTLPLRVVKVGGSLLDRPPAMEQLPDWIQSARATHRLLFICGGGAPVDWLREQTARGKLDETEAHWEAIRQMDYNADCLSSIFGLPEVELADSPVVEGAAVGIVDRFLNEVEPHLEGVRLPVGWQVTSDSIAARVASVYNAELVLLKSCPPPSEPSDHASLAQQGYVDDFFPAASLGLRQVLFETL
ncbi:hypothetical protein Pla123a_26040 [Posidoniimonas polymericola]|uniref:Aspartate/glutamate/uridylate kinase domain-containing protein n=1 Tax=Posidoniimonas polymericola TaxID=2528002 RepID=A0A5C5YLP4_9BACT|nr:hypothetical protein [Posidoniimonas polymericola]TWT75822.1 hypothetical protein Pla123a_26040 [Posidoniimonas polymericola]